MKTHYKVLCALTLAAAVGLPSLRAEEPKKPTPAPAKPAPVAAKPAPAPARPAAPSALSQAQTIRRDQQRYDADTAGRINYDGARRPTPAPVAPRATPLPQRKTAAQISAEQNKIPRAQTPANYKRKPTEPPKP